MRYIFMDEAGTSAHEPVTIVVGLIANADTHIMPAEALALEALGGVPEKFKKDFHFHAKEVFGNRKYHEDWSLSDRLNLLYAMMSIPRKIGMAVVVSVVWRNAVDFSEACKLLSLSQAQFEHLMAFNLCLAVADRNIRKHAAPNEIAAIVAEDIPEMRRFLKAVHKVLRESPINLPISMLRETLSDKEAGYSTQSGDIRITRIRNSPFFVSKTEDSIVQLADACAYGFRRFFSDEKFGLDFVNAILGDEKMLRNFGKPSGAECYWPNS